MTDRASFLAAIRATPRGDDPGLPDRLDTPDAPTELVTGEDLLDRFQMELEAVSAIVSRALRDDVGAAVVASLQAAGAYTIALADDLGPLLNSVRDACVATGLDVASYTDIAQQRARIGALDATVTGCLRAVAATGSIVTSAPTGRASALIAPTHVCVVRQEQVLPGLHALFDGDALAGAGSQFALQSGPSRSSDIEKTLILGVHGPGRVHVIVVPS